MVNYRRIIYNSLPLQGVVFIILILFLNTNFILFCILIVLFLLLMGYTETNSALAVSDVRVEKTVTVEEQLAQQLQDAERNGAVVNLYSEDKEQQLKQQLQQQTSISHQKAKENQILTNQLQNMRRSNAYSEDKEQQLKQQLQQQTSISHQKAKENQILTNQLQNMTRSKMKINHDKKKEIEIVNKRYQNMRKQYQKLLQKQEREKKETETRSVVRRKRRSTTPLRLSNEHARHANQSSSYDRSMGPERNNFFGRRGETTRVGRREDDEYSQAISIQNTSISLQEQYGDPSGEFIAPEGEITSSDDELD